MAVVPRTKAAAQNNLAAIAAIPPVFVIKNILAYRVIYPIRFRQADAGMLTAYSIEWGIAERAHDNYLRHASATKLWRIVTQKAMLSASNRAQIGITVV